MNENPTFDSSLQDESLTPEHLAFLSQIDPDVRRERGYFSATDPAELAKVGIHDPLWYGLPALVAPVLVFGRNNSRLYLSHPDVAPDPALLRKGHPRRFGPVPENGANVKPGLCLDQHPRGRVLQSDRDLPTIITESILCGDAAVSRGVPTINLLGICNWQKFYLAKSKNPLADWMGMLLNRNGVYIAFEAHYERPFVERQNLASLVRFLRKKQHAHVFVAHLTDTTEDGKCGLSAFLAHGNTIEDFMRIAVEQKD